MNRDNTHRPGWITLSGTKGEISVCMKRDNPEYMHEKMKPSVVWDLIVTDIIVSDNYCLGSCIRPLKTD